MSSRSCQTYSITSARMPRSKKSRLGRIQLGRNGGRTMPHYIVVDAKQIHNSTPQLLLFSTLSEQCIVHYISCLINRENPCPYSAGATYNNLRDEYSTLYQEYSELKECGDYNCFSTNKSISNPKLTILPLSTST